MMQTLAWGIRKTSCSTRASCSPCHRLARARRRRKSLLTIRTRSRPSLKYTSQLRTRHSPRLSSCTTSQLSNACTTPRRQRGPEMKVNKSSPMKCTSWPRVTQINYTSCQTISQRFCSLTVSHSMLCRNIQSLPLQEIRWIRDRQQTLV